MIKVGVFAATILWFSFHAGSAQTETPAERGRYLVEGIVACGNCHTPRGPDGAQPGDMAMAGGFLIELPGIVAYAPNITPDRQTGIGSWTDDQIKRAIRDGKRPDGSTIGPPMPIEWYQMITDADLDAIVAYITSLPPVRNEVPRSTYDFPLPPAYPMPHVAMPDDATDQVKRGFYLAGPLGHCIECHTPFAAPGERDYANRLGAGGFELPGPWGYAVSANITSDPDDGIAHYTASDIKAIVTTGVRPNGTPLTPPMAFPYYVTISDGDLDDLVAYLRTLPPKSDP